MRQNFRTTVRRAIDTRRNYVQFRAEHARAKARASQIPHHMVRNVDYVCMVNQFMFQTVETFFSGFKKQNHTNSDPKTIILYRVGADIL